jgi:hypothetical protein
MAILYADYRWPVYPGNTLRHSHRGAAEQSKVGMVVIAQPWTIHMYDWFLFQDLLQSAANLVYTELHVNDMGNRYCLYNDYTQSIS